MRSRTCASRAPAGETTGTIILEGCARGPEWLAAGLDMWQLNPKFAHLIDSLVSAALAE
jgi:hypothetical protein